MKQGTICVLGLVLSLFLLQSSGSHSQNLVQNPSFEITSGSTMGCPGYGNLTNWSNPDTSSTPDLFSTSCGGFLALVGAPGNGLGHQYARTGNNYAGFVPYDPGGSNYREYIQGHLSSPLIAGQNYCVKFYVSLADTVPKATNRVGMYLSAASTFYPNSTPSTVLPYTPQLQAPSTAVTDKVNWVKMEWQYTATGGEQYFTIGNFFTDANTTTVSTGGGGGFMQFVYYYIDDISITPGACCDPSIAAVNTLCTNDAPVTLTPGTAGGTWSGPGVNASTGVFTPSVAGPGTHTIIYTLSCGSDSTVIEVSCCGATINPIGNVCVGDAPLTLTAGQSGGTWSGPGITNASAGTFDPGTAGTGTHTIIYTLVGCGSDSLNIAVGSCVSLTACQEQNGDITATSGSAPFTWYNENATQDCSACTFGCAFPPGCAVNVTSWASFATGTTITPSGTYPVKLSDNNGDSLIITSISSLPACPSTSCPTLTITPSNVVNVSCPGLSDGSFDASTTGGVAPWDYTLKNSGGTTVATFSNNAGTQSFTGLSAGIYTLYAFDSNNCPDTITVTITQPSGGSITVNAGPDQTICSNSTILAGNTPSSGTGTWTVISGTGTVTAPTSATSAVSGLGVGTISLQWTINDGCASGSDTVVITNTGGGPTVSISSFTNISCNGAGDGTATASATGGTGTLTYTWTPSGGNASTASNLQAGTYTLSVSDGGGCTGIATTTITEPAVITLNVVTTAAGCSNTGSAAATASGGTGTLGYQWNSGATTSSITNLSAGSYTVTVTDSEGCVEIENATIVSSAGNVVATASQSDTIISFGGSVQLSANGGNTYSWSPSDGLDCSTCRTPVASPIETTVYCVTVSDNGCSDTACVTIIVSGEDCETNYIAAGSVYVPGAFSPNKDELNDVFKPVVNCVHNYNFAVFDRWGEKLFETTDVNAGWNGYYKGGLCKPDVYVYKVTFIDDPKDNYHAYTGRVVLIK